MSKEIQFNREDMHTSFIMGMIIASIIVALLFIYVRTDDGYITNGNHFELEGKIYQCKVMIDNKNGK